MRLNGVYDGDGGLVILQFDTDHDDGAVITVAKGNVAPTITLDADETRRLASRLGKVVAKLGGGSED